MPDHSEVQDLTHTEQGEAWRGEFGDEYSVRNRLDTAELDESYRSKYGVTRTALNRKFLADIPRSASILEVGCNLGNQLLLLSKMGFENLSGVELNPKIAERARLRVPQATIGEGSALSLPFDDASFDLVFTSGVLIHIAPHNLPVAMAEIHRCARNWIWGFEYHASEITEIPYRGRSGLLWKADYARRYAEAFPDLELILEQKLKYLSDDNTDSMFVFRRK